MAGTKADFPTEPEDLRVNVAREPGKRLSSENSSDTSHQTLEMSNNRTQASSDTDDGSSHSRQHDVDGKQTQQQSSSSLSQSYLQQSQLAELNERFAARIAALNERFFQINPHQQPQVPMLSERDVQISMELQRQLMSLSGRGVQINNQQEPRTSEADKQLKDHVAKLGERGVQVEQRNPTEPSSLGEHHNVTLNEIRKRQSAKLKDVHQRKKSSKKSSKVKKRQMKEKAQASGTAELSETWNNDAQNDGPVLSEKDAASSDEDIEKFIVKPEISTDFSTEEGLPTASTSEMMADDSVDHDDVTVKMEPQELSDDGNEMLPLIGPTGSELCSNSNGEFTCPFCPEKLKVKQEFEGHVLNHCNGKDCCTICDKRFKHSATLKVHILFEHMNNNFLQNIDKNYVCSQCGRLYADLKCAKNHVLSAHLKYKLYDCDMCSKSFNTNQILASHKVVHKSAEFKCKFCGALFRRKFHLQTHEYTHSTSEEYTCKICHKHLNPKKFVKHMVTKHNIEPERLVTKPDPATTNKHVCMVCNIALDTKTNLVNHIRQVHPDLEFSCEICSKKFKCKSLVQLHMKRVHIERKYQCTLCNFSFKCLKNLELHVKNHNRKSNEFQCTMCSFNTKFIADLRQHVVVHERKDLYQCSLCSYSSKFNANYQRHMNVHNKQLHQCMMCNFQTKFEGIFKRHLERHNEETRDRVTIEILRDKSDYLE